MFNPKELPAKVRVAWQQGAANWMGVVEAAVSVQMTDINELTDIVFHLHHKERKGKPLNRSDIGLIAEWRALHTLVKARLYGGQNAQSHAWHELVLMGDVAAAREGGRAFPMYHQAIFRNDTIK